MPSPFPGMDPWVEGGDLFRDLHATLITYLREALNATLPPGYAAIGNHLVWMDDAARREPDVSLFAAKPAPPNGAVAVLPGMLAVGADPEPEPWEEPYLEIRSDRGERLVTAVEVLSPSNKARGGAGRKAYLDKQREYRLGGVNAVELDLLRGGEHTTAVSADKLRRVVGPFDYHACVLVAGTPNTYYAAPIRLADRLPAIGIPLDPGVPAVAVDLQPLFDRAYDTGRYRQFLRYDRPPDPPLTAEQQAWASDILKAKGLGLTSEGG